MAFAKNLAERIRHTRTRKKNIDEKKMFGGIGFLLNGNPLVGVRKDALLVRPTAQTRNLLKSKGIRKW
jgi:TfoX/Sxy family transcriptional regulator of competence genes